MAVRACLDRLGTGPEELLAVVDDAALPVGKLRIRSEGSWGGHRGLLSIEQETGSRAYARLRLGVGGPPPEADLADFVLEPLTPEERERFEPLVERAVQAVRDTLREGVAWAMNRVNGGPIVEDPANGGSVAAG
jgi:PTH1 family peptidyl-tRNA hydrolase